MFSAKHHVRVNGVMYRPGEVIEEDPNAAWHLKVGAIEEIAPVAGETPSDVGDAYPIWGGERAAGDVVPREEGTDEAKKNGEERLHEEARENYASQLATLGYQPDGTPTVHSEPEEIDEETPPEEIDVMAGIVPETTQEKPTPSKRKTSTRKREGGKAK